MICASKNKECIVVGLLVVISVENECDCRAGEKKELMVPESSRSARVRIW